MTTPTPSHRLHPLVAAAAVSVTLVSLVGVAAITGVLPTSNSTPAPSLAQSAANIPVIQSPGLHPKQPAQLNAAAEPEICRQCGIIESVRPIQHHAQRGSGVGAVAGAVIGGVLGNQVGGGNGRKAATVAGAIGGGYAGNEIEKRSKTWTSYEIRVRMEDGGMRSFSRSKLPDWRSGDRVKIIDGNLTSA
ncbi:MAG: glycine zipper 2TM domain-containing protein [Pseudomonadota bacterium]